MIINRNSCTTSFPKESYEQLVNYTMIYDGTLGESGESGSNVCFDFTGGILPVAEYVTVSQSGSSVKPGLNFETDHMYMFMGYSHSGYIERGSIRTNNRIDVSEYIGYGISTDLQGGTAKACGSTSNSDKYSAINTVDIPKGKSALSLKCSDFSNQYFRVQYWVSGKDSLALSIFCWWLYKQDDWQTLCEKAGIDTNLYSTEAALCSDSEAVMAILSNEDAVKFMVAQCTGSFMIEALSNETFLSVLGLNYNRIHVLGNEHWSKFMEIYSVEIDYPEVPDSPDQVINYTMLYDYGDECVDVTGGWGDHTVIAGSFKSATVTKEVDHLKIKTTANTQTGRVATNNLLPIKDYSALYGIVSLVKGTSNTNSVALDFGINDGHDRAMTISCGEILNNFSGVVCADISEYTDDAYIEMALDAYPYPSEAKLFNAILAKPDDWQTLCEKAGLDFSVYADEATLCADETAITAIFSDQSVLEWMVLNCTGSFMTAFINSETAINVYKESLNRGVINDNTHWRKFLGMVDAYTEILPTQVINYTMLYDAGDECVDVTGGWSLDGYSYSHYGTSASTPSVTYAMSSGTKMDDHLYLVCSGQYKLQGLGIVNPIDMSGYSVLGSYFEVTGSNAAYNMQVLIASSKTMRTGLGTPNAVGFFGAESTPGYKGLMLGDISAYDYDYVFAMSENANNRSAKMYSLFIAKPDDWQTLCTKLGLDSSAYADESALCSDSNAMSSLMSNTSALEWMVLNCTGSFMASFISSNIALSAYSSSTNRGILNNNEHWRKFLDMVDAYVTDQLINYSILYDAGDECTDTSGGWGSTNYNNHTFSSKGTDHLIVGCNSSSTNYGWYSGFGTLSPIQISNGDSISVSFKINQKSTTNTTLCLDITDKYYNGDYIRNTTILVDRSNSFIVVQDYDTSNKHMVSWYFSEDLNGHLALTGGKNDTSGTVSISVYQVSLVKPDDWQTLCTKAGLDASTYADESALCNDSTAISTILSNESVVNWMLSNCTGSFLAAFVSSSVAMSALDSSTYKTLIQANEHWFKFLSMII